jgi:hypothetical protein
MGRINSPVMSALGYLLTALIRACGGVLELLLKFVERQPLLAVIALGVIAFAILSSLFAYFWVLALGVVLTGIGGRMRQQGF